MTCRHLTLCILCFVFFASTATAQEFFKGKVIRIVLGTPPGGGFDVYSRAISRHMGKHIPGNPTIIIEYMPGAGMMIAANHVYNIAKPDGLTIGNWIGLLVLQQVLGTKGIEFDARRFEWIGTPKGDSPVCALTKASGITSVDSWLAAKTPVKIGGIAPGASTSDIPRVLKAVLNLPVQLVEGYKGTADIRLAADAREVAGGCWPWETMKVNWSQQLASGDVKVVIQAVAKKHAELSDVPNAIDLAKTDEARQLIKAGIIDPAVITQPYCSTRDAEGSSQTTAGCLWRNYERSGLLVRSKEIQLGNQPYVRQRTRKHRTGLFHPQPNAGWKIKSSFGAQGLLSKADLITALSRGKIEIDIRHRRPY